VRDAEQREPHRGTHEPAEDRGIPSAEEDSHPAASAARTVAVGFERPGLGCSGGAHDDSFCHSLPLIARCGAKECPMQSMNISLPEPQKQFVDDQTSTGRYSSACEYVRELIRADEKRKAEEQLEAKLLEGHNGAESALTLADWTAIRQEARAKVEARKPAR
jgi:antitoxin ParD1/3/4